MVAEVGRSVHALWEVSDTRSEDESGAGADSTADVPFSIGALSWSDTAGAVSTAMTAISS